jgi:microcystin-dependent protein
MAEPFLSEIRIMSFNFPPKGWALCNGQLLPINQNQALFSLLGTTYGGNGQTNFALPDLRGRVPIHFGSGQTLGQAAGEPSHTLTISEMAQHLHLCQGYSQNGDQPAPTGFVIGTVAGLYAGSGSANLVAFAGASVGNAGGSQAHENRMPLLTLNFCIALQGIFPSQT